MRVLLVIGCDQYVFLDTLHGAEHDAATIHKLLLDPTIGEYDEINSILLLSPSLDTLRDGLRTVLFGHSGSVDTFTFFFAGHGGIKAGTYYLCTTDSRSEMLSTTAYGMSALFAAINEAQPRQSNIILDTCQGGGVVADLPTVIKPELIGGSDTPGISIFVSSAADQYSGEDDAGGFGTNALLRCIDGTVVVQTTRPTMDVLEVGRVASSLIAKHHSDQTPLLWGLNLYGEARFCKNLHYGGVVPTVAALPQISSGSRAYEMIRENADRVWSEYFSVTDRFEARRFVDMGRTVVSSEASEGVDAAAFCRGLADAFALRAAAAADVFRGVEVIAACLSILLEQAEKENVRETMLEMGCDALAMNRRALEETLKIMNENEFALLSDRGGFGNLFYLPLRLSRLLGWIGAQHFIEKWTDWKMSELDEREAKTLLKQIVRSYSGSLVAVSDVQSPYILTFFACCYERGWNEEAGVILGHMFNDFVRAGGRLARTGIDEERVFEYLQRRAAGNYGNAFDLLAHPAEMLSVLLLAASWFELEDVVDPYLHLLDHHSFNVFLPRTYRAFSEATIRDGVNHTYRIGHGIWKTEDFRSKWDESCRRQINADSALTAGSVRVGALVASLLFPDRCSWFLGAGR